MIQETDKRILLLIVDKIVKLEQICSNHSLEEIQNSFIYSNSIQFEFEKMFEDTTRLSIMFKCDHPEIPIDKLRGIRNRVAHDYESVIIKKLFDTVINDLPELKKAIQTLLK